MSILQERVTKDKLIAGLSDIPDNWALTPVNGNKAPYRKNWNKETPPTRDELIEEFRSGQAKGYGLLTGPVSGGIVAVDCDGEPAHELADKLGGLPPTVSFTSGKPGRAQYLYRVPQERRGKVKTKKLKTGKNAPDGKQVMLELRWDGCQSVLPPSEHPETGQYRWINSPQEIAIAAAPEWVFQQMLDDVPQPLPFVAPSEPVPLTVILAPKHRNLIKTGVSEGGRNDAGAALARDLIGASNGLDYLGYRCENNPRDLFDQYCDRCNPPLSPRERETIWKSAEGDNPTPCLSDDKIEACIKAHRRQPIGAIGSSVKQETGGAVEKETLQILKDLETVKRAFGSRIRYNTRFKQVEIDGEPINPDAPEIDLAKKGGIQIKGSVRIKHQIILDVAKENSFDPFLNYLEDCHKRWDGVSQIGGYAKRCFGADNPLHQRYLECLLVGTVARAHKPGCKFDTLFVLHGEQGLGKSTWFRKMVGDDFFCDDMGDFKDKDERLKMHQSAWTEWAEVENNINRSTSGKTKAFITTQTDNIRPPYAQRSAPYPRMSVLVGSTNRTDFNHDETGARRFMVIPVSQPIPVDLVDEERDRLWGEAVDLYKRGYQFHLTREEQQQANLLNEEFTDRGYLHDLIEEFVADKDEVWTEEVKEWLDTKEDEKYKIGEFSRLERDIKKVMTGIGFKHGRWQRNGPKKSGYRRIHPIQQTDRQTGSGQAADRQGVHLQTPTEQEFQAQRTGRTPKTVRFVENNISPTDTPDRPDAPQSESTRSQPDDPSTVGGDRTGDTPKPISCATEQECEGEVKRIIKANCSGKQKRISQKELLSNFVDEGKVLAVLEDLKRLVLIEVRGGYIYPVPLSDPRSPFARGKQVVIVKEGDRFKNYIGTITNKGKKGTIYLTVEGQSQMYSIKDLKPHAN